MDSINSPFAIQCCFLLTFSLFPRKFRAYLQFINRRRRYKKAMPSSCKKEKQQQQQKFYIKSKGRAIKNGIKHVIHIAYLYIKMLSQFSTPLKFNKIIRKRSVQSKYISAVLFFYYLVCLCAYGCIALYATTHTKRRKQYVCSRWILTT